MIKKILYCLMVLIIVVGAEYSYSKVGFARKTAMMFQVVFGDASTMGPGGRPPMGANIKEGQIPGTPPGGARGQFPPGDVGRQGTPQGIEQGDQGGQTPGFQGGERGGTPPKGGINRAGGPGGPGGVISLTEVILYTFIFAFFVLITCIIDGAIKRLFLSKSKVVNVAA